MGQAAEEPLRRLKRDYALAPFESRHGTVWHYRLPNDREMGIYLLLWGVARLYIGDCDNDSWERGYDYGSYDEAVAAAERWIDTDEPPPGPWIREHGGKEK